MANFIQNYFELNNSLPPDRIVQRAIESGQISAEEAQTSMSELQAIQTRNDTGAQSGLGRAAVTTLNAVTAGLGDDILGSFGATGARDYVRASEDRFADENPVANFGAQAAGFLVPGGLISKGLSAAARGTGIGSRVAQTASATPLRNAMSTGAIEGAAAGFGYADEESVNDRLDDALFGATVGGIGGGILQGGGSRIARIFTGGSREQSNAQSLNAIAEEFGITPQELIRQGREGYDLVQIGMNAGRTTEESVNSIRRIADISNSSTTSVARNARDIAPEQGVTVRQSVDELSYELSDDLARPTLNDAEPFRNTINLRDTNREFGEQLGNRLSTTPVTNDVVSSIMDDAPDAIGFSKEVNSILGDEADFNLSNRLETDESITLLSRDAERPSGFYVTRDNGDIVRPVTDEINLNILATVARNLRAKASSEIGEGGTARNTALGAYENRLNRTIGEVLRGTDPEVDQLYSQYIRNSAVREINDTIGDSLTKTTVRDLDKVRPSVLRAVNRAKEEGLPTEELESVVRNAMRRAVDTGDYDATLKSLSNKNTELFLNDVISEAGINVNPSTYIDDVRNSILQENLANKFNMAVRNANPENVARTVKSLLDDSDEVTGLIQDPVRRETIEQLVDTARKTNDELIEINSIAKLKPNQIEEVTGAFERFLNQLPFSVVVFGLTAKGLSVAALRGAAGREGLGKFLNRKQIPYTNELIEALAQADDQVLNSTAIDTAIRMIEENDTRGFTTHFIQRFKDASISAGLISPTGNSEESTQTENQPQGVPQSVEEIVTTDSPDFFQGIATPQNTTSSPVTIESLINNGTPDFF